MFSPWDQDWLDARIKQREDCLKQEFWKIVGREAPVLDAGTFAQPLADATRILINKVERDGPTVFPNSNVPLDTSVILRQLSATYR
ncbi:MAG: hypothetical protein ABSE87_09700, partial [Terracidiphilus sp.]